MGNKTFFYFINIFKEENKKRILHSIVFYTALTMRRNKNVTTGLYVKMSTREYRILNEDFLRHTKVICLITKAVDNKRPQSCGNENGMSTAQTNTRGATGRKKRGPKQ